MDDVKLISLVSKYEELYDGKHENYYNKPRRDNLWDEIGKSLNTNGYTCRERWKKVRDNYRKAWQLRRQSKAQKTMNPPKFHKKLKFLLPYLHDEELRRNNQQITESIELVEPYIPNPPSPVPSTSSSITSAQCDPRDSDLSAPRTKRSRSSNSDNTSALLLKELLQHTADSRNTPSEDPLIAFFLTMARTVKTFPFREQLRIKKEVFSIVNDTELKLATWPETPEIAESTDSPTNSGFRVYFGNAKVQEPLTDVSAVMSQAHIVNDLASSSSKTIKKETDN